MTLANDFDLTARFIAAEQAKRCLRVLDRRTSRLLMTRVSNGTVVRVQPGYFARRVYWDTLTLPDRYMHILRTSRPQDGKALYKGFAAAFLWGLDLPKECLQQLKLKDMEAITYKTPARNLAIVNGFTVTPLAQTLLDCLAELDFPCGVALVDSAIRAYPAFDREMLARQFKAMGIRRRGYQKGLAALENSCSESPHADISYLRALAYQLGFTKPYMFSQDGVDMVWDGSDTPAVPANLYGKSERYAHLPAHERGTVDGSGAIERFLIENGPLLRINARLLQNPEELAALLNRAGVQRRRRRL